MLLVSMTVIDPACLCGIHWLILCGEFLSLLFFCVIVHHYPIPVPYCRVLHLIHTLTIRCSAVIIHFMSVDVSEKCSQ